MIDATLLNDIARGRNLDHDRMCQAVRTLMTGGATHSQMGAFLMGLRMKGESIDEIAAAAEVMRELATDIPVPPTLRDELVDTCGTGGDSYGLFNVSTAAAFVVAAAGGHVAKHGNRSVSSRSGSSDLLEAMGLHIDNTPQDVADCLQATGVGFMYAPAHHGAMRHIAPVRRELGIRNLFNLLGPLTNPAGARNQVMGVFNGHLCEPLARVLGKLGSRHVLVVHGDEGLDELSLAGPTRVAELRHGEVHCYRLVPEDVGLSRQSLAPLRVDDAQQSLHIIEQAFAGRSQAAANMIAYNAGAALYVSGHSHCVAAGVARALDTIHSGAAARHMTRVAEFTRQQAHRQLA